MRHHKFAELRTKMSPARRARNEAAARSMLAEMLVRELREQSGMTQRDLAAALGVSQPTLAQMEKQADMRVSTLRRIVEALGGTLELVVRLPQGEFRVPPLRRKRSA